jgi:hypothetical protein
MRIKERVLSATETVAKINAVDSKAPRWTESPNE